MNEKQKFQRGCDVTSLAAPGVRTLQPYLPGKPISELEREYGVSDIIKLASNENPLGASPVAIEAMAKHLDDLALYPDGGGYDLHRALALKHAIEPESITLGNGSNDVLVMLAEAFLGPGSEAIYSQYAFAVYPIAVQATGATAKVAAARPLGATQALGHDLDAMSALISDDTRIIFIANPNNPTGTWLGAEELLGFMGKVPGHVLVVIDEAYYEYAQALGVPDASGWMRRYPNLVVTRTFSKAYGLAGIRIGYSLSSPQVADMLNRVRQPFNVNSLALCAAQAALADQAFIATSVRTNQQGISQLTAGLESLGRRVFPSAGNFLLVDFGVPPGEVYESLLRHGVIVRPVGNYQLMTHLRITVGTPEQNELLLKALHSAGSP